MKQSVLIIKQKDDQDLWVELREFLWFNNKKLFDLIEQHTYLILNEEKNKIEYKEEQNR